MSRFYLKKVQLEEGSENFKKLVYGFTNTLWWPANENDLFLQEIRLLLNQPEQYPQLLLPQQPDLRPFLLYLLYHDEIDNETFTTLHMLAQIKASGYKKFTAGKLSKNLGILNFDSDKRAEITQKITDQDIIYKVKMSEFKIYTHLVDILSVIKGKVSDHDENYAMYLFYKNSYFFKQIINFFPETEKNFILMVKKLTVENIDVLVNIIKKLMLKCFGPIVSLDFQDVIFENSSISYFTYHYNKDDGWFFYISSSSTLNTYLEIKTQQKPYMQNQLTYRLLTPLEMGEATLNDVRLMNLVPYGNKIDLIIHGVTVKDPFTVSLHDWYHYFILGHLPKAMHEIRKHWIKLLQQETGEKLSYYLWRIMDAEYVSCLRYDNVDVHLSKCFKNAPEHFFKHDLIEPHEWYILMVDMIVHPNSLLWKDLDPISLFQELTDNTEIDFIKEQYAKTRSLTKTAAAVYLKRNQIALPLGKISWKKDDKPIRNALSLYMNGCSLRDIVNIANQAFAAKTQFFVINHFLGSQPIKKAQEYDTLETKLFFPVL